MKRCDFCIEEQCGGKKECDCDNCEVKDKCNKFIVPTIRITLKCTQSCTHCCYSCSPKEETHMDVSTSINIAKFLTKYQIQFINLMGGEISCNPNYKEILTNIIPAVKMVRVVSNGDWNEDFIKFISQFENIYICISKDRWHTNKNVERAIDYCKKYNVIYKVATKEQTTPESIVPIGRGYFEFNMFASLMTYCSNPEHKYSIMIDECGKIFKCSFGIWEISDVTSNSFFKEFKKFNQKFHNTFIPSCRACIRAHDNTH